VGARDWDSAYAMIAPASKIEKADLVRDVSGTNSSLRTISTLQQVEAKQVSGDDSAAQVRTNLKWSTAVGALSELRDLKLVKDGSDWRILWPASTAASAKIQTVQTPYLRWDVVQRASESREEFGAQNVEVPRMRIISMNALSATAT